MERKLAAVIVQGHMRKRLAADEWQTRRSAAAHMQACYRGRRDRETVATHHEGRNELKAASEAAAAEASQGRTRCLPDLCPRPNGSSGP